MLITYGRSDKGRVRPNNQDSFSCGRLSDTVAYTVVCDGMGGVNGGNIASSIAMKVISDHLISAFRPKMNEAAIRRLLFSAISAANIKIFDEAMETPNLHGMGTTVVVTVSTEEQVYICHVGDSRAYMDTAQDIRQITRDHSIVQQMVESGQITAEQAKTHPRKHFLTKALGVEETVEPEFTAGVFPPDGILLVCTDGLTNMVDPAQLHQILRKNAIDEVADKLLNTANLAGGSDNITAVLVTRADS